MPTQREPGHSGIDPRAIVDYLYRCITVSDGEPGGERAPTRRYVLFPCRRATFLSCTYAGNMCSTWRELDLGQWKQSVLKDFLYRHSAPGVPASRERPG